MLALVAGLAIFTGCTNQKSGKNESTNAGSQILGTWLRFGPAGIATIEFKDNGLVESDMGNDGTIDVTSTWKIEGDTIIFEDIRGETCPGSGKYRFYLHPEYLSFDLEADSCGGRIKTTMGFWTRPDFEEILSGLDEQIENQPEPRLFLTRARVAMAAGLTRKAQKDFDRYLETDSTDARAYLNRAGTRFPRNMEGALADCNRAISLDPDNKNAYFLRGLALYSLGKTEEACADFSTAIELGFTILKVAEKRKCEEFWIED